MPARSAWHFYGPEHTLARLSPGSRYATRPLDRVQVRGRTRPVTIFEVFDADEPQLKAAKLALQETYQAALASYYADRFDAAVRGFEACAARLPEDGVINMWLKRSRHGALTPPELAAGEAQSREERGRV